MLKKYLQSIILLFILFIIVVGSHAQEIAPARGSLVIVGGSMRDPAIIKRFLDLAGGHDVPIVVIPTAGDGSIPFQV
jgi:hypothetical protein